MRTIPLLAKPSTAPSSRGEARQRTSSVSSILRGLFLAEGSSVRQSDFLRTFVAKPPNVRSRSACAQCSSWHRNWVAMRRCTERRRWCRAIPGSRAGISEEQGKKILPTKVHEEFWVLFFPLFQHTRFVFFVGILLASTIHNSMERCLDV